MGTIRLRGNLFVVFLVLATVNIVHSIREPQEYLSKKYDLSNRTQVLEWVLQQIEERSTIDPRQVASFLVRATRIAARATQVPREKFPAAHLDDTGVLGYEGKEFFSLLYVLTKLLDIAKLPTDELCFSESIINELIHVINVAFGDIANFNILLLKHEIPYIHPKLFLYLREFGTEHYQYCLTRINDEFARIIDSIDENRFEKLDEFLIKSKKLSVLSDDKKLAYVARNMDLTNTTLNVQEVVESMKKFYTEEDIIMLNLKKGSHFIAQFLSTQCFYLEQNLNVVFQVYNLSRVFIPEQVSRLEVSSKFIKLNEYWRLCNQIRSPLVRIDVIRNFDENKNKAWFRYLFERKTKPKTNKRLLP